MDGQISETGDSVHGYNLFAYCFNNSINMSDESGHWPRWITAAVAVVSTAVAVVATVVAAPAVAIAAATVGIVSGVTLIAQTIHYDVRQSKNTDLPKSPQAANNAGWKNSNKKTNTNPNGGGPAADLHQYSSKDKSNVKYVSPDGKSEIIFDKFDVPVLDPRDIGTYNFIPSGSFWGTIGHGLFDVVPWVLFGNSDDDWGPLINIFTD